MKKLLSLIIAAAFLLSVCTVFANAYGSGDGKMIITHINTQNTTEGSAIIIDGGKYETLGQRGNFAWWSVFIFDWDSTDKCYKLVEKDTNSNNHDKSAMEIPETGFAYGACVGNDYSATGGINYKQTTRVKDSITVASSLNIGDKVYLYNVNLLAGQIQNNGKAWYALDYVSDSFIKVGEPEPGLDAYDPENAEVSTIQYIIETNNYNSTHYESGDCILFDSKNSNPLQVEKDYSWWRSVVFSWDAAQQCFVCAAKDDAAGNGNAKSPMIPDNGFVIMDCYSPAADAIISCVPGTKAWLYKMSDGHFRVCLNKAGNEGTEVKYGTSQIDAPKLSGADAKNTLKVSDGEVKLQWNAVTGADYYLIEINTANVNLFGKSILNTEKVNTNSYTLKKGTVSVGSSFTVFLQAVKNGESSVVSMYKVSCLSETALNSSLREKTVMAFGDSLTARPGWVSMLGGFIGADVINAGVGGDSTNAGKARFKSDVLKKKPDVVLMCFGMNDQAQLISSKTPNVPLKTYIANMEYMIEEMQKIGTDVILICPHDAYAANGYYKPGEYGLDYAYGNMEQFCDAVRQMAVKYECGLIDIYTESKAENMAEFLNYGDGIHQSTYGHQKWAEYVSDYLLAKYDGIEKATISVQCKDRDSDAVLKEYSFVVSKGASIRVPAADIEGKLLIGDEDEGIVSKDKTVTYLYRGESDFPIGDVDGNGVVETKDYVKLKRRVLNTYTAKDEAEESRMDVDGNGSVEAKDYVMLKRVVLGTYSFKKK